MDSFPESLRWRWWFVKRYLFLLRTFRNGLSLARALWRNQSCDRVVLWDGTCLLHPPGRVGFIPTLLEIWHENSYARRKFYRPASGDVVIDAGANVGLFSIWIARQAPGCRIVALEPFEENFVFLQKNLEAAKVKHAAAHQIALGGCSGWGQMVAVGARSLDHHLVPSGDPQGDKQRVPVVSLTDLLEKIDVERIAFLKVDIEGAESVVFGNIEASTMDRIDNLAIEYHENLSPGVTKLLAQKLEPTHCLTFYPEAGGKYGILFGKRRRQERSEKGGLTP